MSLPEEVRVAPVCAMCGQPVAGTHDVACGLCAAPHHPDCWEYTGICSAYGCGGIVTVAWSRELVPLPVTIDETTPVPSVAGWRLHGVARRLLRRSADLKRTLAAGLVGGVVASVVLVLHEVRLFGAAALLAGGPLASMTRGYMAVLVFCGLLHGFLAPFVAPLQHRHPLRTAMVAGALSLGAWLMGGWFVAPLFVVTVLAGIVTTWSAAEWLLGDYRPLGRRAGRAAPLLRYAVAAGIFMLSSLLASAAVGLPVTGWLVAEVGLWTLLATGAGGPSMEAGKEEYRKHLVALVERQRGEVGGAPPCLPDPTR